jgi:phosphoribosylpyrophosphate synthetase
MISLDIKENNLSWMCYILFTHIKRNVEVVDMTPLFAEAIYRAQEGLSISKLFE